MEPVFAEFTLQHEAKRPFAADAESVVSLTTIGFLHVPGSQVTHHVHLATLQKLESGHLHNSQASLQIPARLGWGENRSTEPLKGAIKTLGYCYRTLFPIKHKSH